MYVAWSSGLPARLCKFSSSIFSFSFSRSNSIVSLSRSSLKVRTWSTYFCTWGSMKSTKHMKWNRATSEKIPKCYMTICSKQFIKHNSSDATIAFYLIHFFVLIGFNVFQFLFSGQEELHHVMNGEQWLRINHSRISFQQIIAKHCFNNILWGLKCEYKNGVSSCCLGNFWT